MPSLLYGSGAYARDRGNLPELPMVNVFVEKADSEQAPVIQSRPGLVEDQVLGAGPIRATMKTDGSLGGKRITVSGNNVFADAVEVGVVDGTGPVSIAMSEAEALICAGQGLFWTDGENFTQVEFPDDADVSSVAFLAGHFVAARKGTNKWYWSAVLDGTSWDGLDFASAENEPDDLRAIVVVNDMLAMLGSATVEFWPRTGDPNIPFAPQQGITYDKGVRDAGTVVAFDNGLLWLAPNGVVYRSGNVPQRLSQHWIEAKALASSGAAVFRFEFEGHEFGCIRLDNGCYLYDAATQQWSEFASWGLSSWRVGCADAGLFGDALSGKLMRLEGFADLGGVLERRFRAGFPLSGGAIPVQNVRLRMNTGQATTLAGEYSNPRVECRMSRDAGQTWGVWRGANMGAQGAYRTRLQWRRWGIADEPGALFEFRCSDPVPFRVSGAFVNEQGGGRSR